MWGYLYGPDFGPFAQLSGVCACRSRDFLSDGWMLGSLANIVTWEFVGYNMIILYAALRSDPAGAVRGGRGRRRRRLADRLVASSSPPCARR